MHANIYQISKSEVDKDCYLDETTLYCGDGNFIDYCSDIEECDREAEICKLVGTFLPEGMFTMVGGNAIRYNGGIDAFLEKWIENIRKAVGKMTKDTITESYERYRLRMAIDNPLNSDTLFYLDDDGTSGYAKRPGDFFDMLKDMEPGDLLYVGGIVDYHY